MKQDVQNRLDGGQKKTARGIRWYWGLSVIGLALLGIANWSVVYLQMHALEQELASRQAQAGAEGLAGRLSESNLFRQDVLQAISSDAELSQLFLKQHKEALKAREGQLKAILPGAMRVRLLPVGIDQPDASAVPPLGYASLEQLRLAEKQAGVLPAEVHQFSTPQQHISMVAAVRERGTGPVVGLIQALFSMDGLGTALDSLGDYAGRIEVRQVASNAQPFSLLHKGPEGVDRERPAGALAVEGSIWEVVYWAISGRRDGLQNELVLLSGVLLVLLVSALLFFLMEAIRQALERDQRSILSLVEALIVGRPPKQYQAHLADMQATLDVLQHQIKEQRLSQTEPPRQKRPLSASQLASGMLVEEVGQRVVTVSHENVELSASIFRAYDIRGVVGEGLTREVANLLGQSFGSEIFDRGLQTVVVGRDGRDSSEGLQSALIVGLQASGREVVDVGLVPTPVLYFAAHELKMDSGAMVTGSHNPKEYNGLKMVVNGESISPQAIQDLRRRIDAGQLLQGSGSFDSREIIPDYIERIVSDIRLAKPMKLVIDCGNGAASVVAPELYRQLGCEVIELYCEVDGRFPNHHPDPGQPENMTKLQQAVVENRADLGLAFDGDGDRLGVVDSSGKLIWPDRLLMYLAIDVLTREPGGDIVYDVKCTRHLANVVLSNGGRPLMWKSGHSLLKAKMKETHALLAGEFSGHIMFSERWYGFDDGLYVGARLLEILALDYRSSAEAFAELPDSLATPEYVLPMQEGQSRKVMEAMNQLPDPPGARVLKIDGIRAEFEEGWGLVRASNTTPSLLFRFESDSQEGLEKVKGFFRQYLAKVDTNLKMPF
ncbi:MAG: phosphomannomutase/phosphoglucomutase [Pseudomonadota bacterium]